MIKLYRSEPREIDQRCLFGSFPCSLVTLRTETETYILLIPINILSSTNSDGFI